MKRLRPMLLLLAFSTILFSLLQIPVSPAVFELAHDDGDFDYGWSDFYPSGAAVRFSPPSPSWRIKSIRLHAVCSIRGYGYFYVQIWDSNLNTKYSASFSFNQVFKNNVLDWYTIEVPNVVVTGEFHVVIVPMFTLDGSQLWVSVDNDPPIANTSFIVNADTRETLASMNATSKRPGGFMVRVVGEPTATPSDLKLSSIEFNEDEAIVVLTYPGEAKLIGARLTKPDGSSAEQSVARDGDRLLVRLREEGNLNVFVVTPGNEIIGTSVRLENRLRTLYRSLLLNHTSLQLLAGEMRKNLTSLSNVVSDLRLELRDVYDANKALLNQIGEMRSRLEDQMRQIAGLREENSRLLNLLKAAVIILAVTAATVILLALRLRRKGK